MNEQVDSALKSFDSDGHVKRDTDEACKLLEQFQKRYPFRQNPLAIDGLKPTDLWEKGNQDSFFQWLEYGLKDSGHLYIGSRIVFDNAVQKIEDLKQLLKVAVDDSKEIHEKIDADWGRIKFFGGDKHIAKKIVYCYYPEKVIPIFKTEELEHFCSTVGIDDKALKTASVAKFGRDYENLNVGEQWQILNASFLELKSRIGKNWSNLYFARFLYDSFHEGIPARASGAAISQPVTPLNRWGLLFAPRNHEETMYMFSVLHKDLGFPYILQMGTPYPDITALNEKGETKRIEIELFASQFEGHDPKRCDYIVCWENDLEEKPPNYPEIIVLKDYL